MNLNELQEIATMFKEFMTAAAEYSLMLLGMFVVIYTLGEFGFRMMGM